MLTVTIPNCVKGIKFCMIISLNNNSVRYDIITDVPRFTVFTKAVKTRLWYVDSILCLVCQVYPRSIFLNLFKTGHSQ